MPISSVGEANASYESFSPKPHSFNLCDVGILSVSIMLGSVIIIRPTPVSITKLNGPLLLIDNCTTTILRTSLNGMATFLRCGSKSNCAYAVVKIKQFKYNSHNNNLGGGGRGGARGV